MITPAASQAALFTRSNLALFTLFHLTTYTDRSRGTVASEEFWSLGKEARYKWNGGALRDFLGVVRAASPVAYQISHLPQPGAADTRRTGLRLELENGEVDGQPLWKTLSAKNLALARLEVATILVEPERMAPGTTWWDLSDLSGTEHVYRFRGELTAVGDVSDESIPLTFEGEEPNLDWPEAIDATAVDAKDLGRRYSIPFGAAKGVPCVNRSVGWATTLAAPLTPSQTGNVDVTDATGLPASGSFTLQLGGERVTATKVDADTINISARAQGGTLAASHQAGESILEVQSSIVVVVAGVPCKALDALYVINPATREKVKVTTGYTVDLDDRDVDRGRRLTTVTFTQAQLEDLIDNLAAAAGDPYDELRFNHITEEAPGGTSWGDVTLTTETRGIRIDAFGSAQPFQRGLFTIDAAAIPTAFLNRPISRVRVRALYNGEGDTTDGGGSEALTRFQGEAKFIGWGVGPTNVIESLDYTFQAGAPEHGVAVATNWVTPAFAKTGSDLDEIECRFWLDGPAGAGVYGSDNWAFVFGDSLVVEVEFGPAPLSSLGAASYGWGLQFVADVQGVMVPHEFSGGYGFDEGTGWSTAGGAVQTDLGGSQRVACPALSLIGDPAGACDDHTLWTANACAKANETTIKTQGTGSIKITPNAAGSDAYIERNFTSVEDWTGKAIAIDLRPEGATHLAPTDGVQVRFEDGGGDWRRWDFGTADGLVIGEFVTLVIDPAVGWDDASGTFTFTTIDRIRVKCNQYAAGGSTANLLYVDNIRLVDIANPAIAQRNATAAAIDLTGSGSRYRARVKATNVASLASVTLRFSNTAGAGTALPAAYRTVTIPGSELPEGQEVDVEKVASDTGSPGVNNVEMVRIEVLRSAGGYATPSVDVDLLEGATATAAVGWDGATPGTLLEEGPDAIRWLLGELAGVGAENVLGVPTAKTNLGGIKFAGSLNAFGTELGALIARLGFETRTNVVRRERSGGAQYELLVASTAYAFPASVRTLEEVRELREQIRGAAEIATHFRIHYAVELADAQVAQNERAFRALLIATPNANDLAVPTAAELAATELLVGRRDAPPLYLLFAQAEATAKDVAGYYAAEASKTTRRRWSARVPLWESYDLEPGDVVAFTPRWASGGVKARVVGTTIDFRDVALAMQLEEVT